MAIQTKSTLRGWFLRGMKPLASQFADWMDSYWHKEEKIPSGKINGLQSMLDEKADVTTLSGMYNVTQTLADELEEHTEDTENPHEVTAEQVGLGNVDNTSDANKPISTAMQTALDGKAATAHTHLYAGSETEGGAARLANVLNNKVMNKGTSLENMTLVATKALDYETYRDMYLTLLIDGAHNSNSNIHGIVTLRCNGTEENGTYSVGLLSVAGNVSPAEVVAEYSNATASGSGTVNLYVRHKSVYSSYRISVLSNPNGFTICDGNQKAAATTLNEVNITNKCVTSSNTLEINESNFDTYVKFVGTETRYTLFNVPVNVNVVVLSDSRLRQKGIYRIVGATQFPNGWIMKVLNSGDSITIATVESEEYSATEGSVHGYGGLNINSFSFGKFRFIEFVYWNGGWYSPVYNYSAE